VAVPLRARLLPVTGQVAGAVGRGDESHHQDEEEEEERGGEPPACHRLLTSFLLLLLLVSHPGVCSTVAPPETHRGRLMRITHTHTDASLGQPFQAELSSLINH